MATVDTLDRPGPELTAERVRQQRHAIRRRGVLVTALLAAFALGLFVLTMMLGSYRLTPWEVVGSVLGLSNDPSVDFVVRDLRLPTALTGLGVGIAFGMSGIIFQKLLANPLASPDFVGVSSGASLFAVSSIVLWNVQSIGVSGFALIGAFASATLIYLLAWRDGVTGYRFILIGIGVSEFMLAITGYIIARAQIYDAREAMTWLVGSIGQAGDGELRLLWITLALLVPAALLLRRQLGVLELGDDSAKGLGARVEVARIALILVSIVLIAVGTAAAGPLAFVALIAGPIAVRLVGPGNNPLPAAGCVGAIIVLAADLVCQHLLPVTLPTGVLTGAIGAPYLIWLLATVNREGRGG